MQRHLEFLCEKKILQVTTQHNKDSHCFVFWNKIATGLVFFVWFSAPSWHWGWLLVPSLSYFTWAKQIITVLFVLQAQSPLWWHLKSLLLAEPGTEIQSYGEVSHLPGIICHFLHQMRLRWWKKFLCGLVTHCTQKKKFSRIFCL